MNLFTVTFYPLIKRLFVYVLLYFRSWNVVFIHGLFFFFQFAFNRYGLLGFVYVLRYHNVNIVTYAPAGYCQELCSL